MSAHPNIMQFDVHGLQKLMESMNQKPYRARQLAEWLYLRGAQSFDEMDNLPSGLRQALKEQTVFVQPQLLKSFVDPDGTVRYVLKLSDGALTETVAIPSRGRLTVCFSTQVGCALACTFCATGKLGLSRSLLTGEILAQLAMVANTFSDTRVSNAVAMGQGEPFANYEATLSALRMMNSSALFGIGARHITVSSAGLPTQIKRFAGEPEQFTLAISLHSAEQRVRNSLMPGLASQRLDKLREALLSYMQKTARRVSLEYALIDGVNDGNDALASLLAFCDAPAPGFHVNLLPLNRADTAPADVSILKGASSAAFARFEKGLGRAGVSVSRRVSKGTSIAAACGQLVSSRQLHE